MTPDPRCAAVAIAKERTGLSYTEIAVRMKEPEQRVIDICTGAVSPTEAEFNSLAQVLEMKSDAVDHTGVHATKP